MSYIDNINLNRKATTDFERKLNATTSMVGVYTKDNYVETLKNNNNKNNKNIILMIIFIIIVIIIVIIYNKKIKTT